MVEENQPTLATVVVTKLRKYHSWGRQVLVQSEACCEGEGLMVPHKFSDRQGWSRTEPSSLPKKTGGEEERRWGQGWTELRWREKKILRVEDGSHARKGSAARFLP